MASTLQKAARGNKKAMTDLFDTYKNEIYSFCCILLNDKQKAAFAASNAFNGIWKKLSDENIASEDEFRRKLFVSAAHLCSAMLFGTNADFKVTKTSAVVLSQNENKHFEGNVANGVAHLQNVLEKAEPHQRFVYLLHLAGGFDFKRIAVIIKQREAVAKYLYQSAALFVERTLPGQNKSDPEVGQIPSLLDQALSAEKMPESFSSGCVKQIEKCAKRYTPNKKIWIPVLCGALCVIVLIAVIAAIPKQSEKADNEEEYSSDITDTEDETDAVELHTPIALDESLTYYADIDIQDYGTVTVKLDQASAPISAANFVELAESGFYDGLTFHRIMEGFMMQGDDPQGNGYGGADYNIFGEFTDNGWDNSLSHTRGAISMARSSNGYDTASSQFFIVQEDSTSLDGQYAVFGYVTEGMDIVDSICESAEPTDDNGTIEAEDQPIITSITIRTEE